jgi:hypothetical protein
MDETFASQTAAASDINCVISDHDGCGSSQRRVSLRGAPNRWRGVSRHGAVRRLPSCRPLTLCAPMTLVLLQRSALVIAPQGPPTGPKHGGGPLLLLGDLVSLRPD